MSKAKNWLWLIPVVGLILVGSFFYSKHSRFQSRVKVTQPALDVHNGTLGDQKMRQAAATAVSKLSAFKSSPIEMIAFRIMPGRVRYIVEAYWVGLEKEADGLEIGYANGRKVSVSFSKDTSMIYSKPLFFSAMVFSEDLPEGFSADTPELVSTVTLTLAGEKCSNTVEITEGGRDSDIWTKAIGSNVNDDFLLWGFGESAK